MDSSPTPGPETCDAHTLRVLVSSSLRLVRWSKLMLWEDCAAPPMGCSPSELAAITGSRAPRSWCRPPCCARDPKSANRDSRRVRSSCLHHKRSRLVSRGVA